MGLFKNLFNASKGKGREMTATDLLSADPRKIGRRVKLWFVNREKPELRRIEFHSGSSDEFSYLEQQANDKDHRFSWTEVPQALSLLFLEYLCAGLEGRGEGFSFPGGQGSLAASLGFAIAKTNGKIFTLFTEYFSQGEECRLNSIFGGVNLEGKEGNERVILIKSDYITPDCVEVFWEREPVTAPQDLRELGGRIRNGWKLEPSHQPEPPSTPAPSEPGAKGESKRPANANPESEQQPEPAPKPTLDDFPDIHQIGQQIFAKLMQGFPPAEIFYTPRGRELNTSLERFTSYCDTLLAALYPDGIVLPEYYEVLPGDHVWQLPRPIFSVGTEPYEEIWTLDDVTQGIMIFGATGSGKTTGSGRLIQQSFLSQKFGGLVLTTKPEEAEDWCLAAVEAGREFDVKRMRYDGRLKINLLAYETQRPGAAAHLTQNLLGFFQTLITATGNRTGQRIQESFWEDAGNQLLRSVFEAFIVAKAPFDLDSIADFILSAPTSPPESPDEWRALPTFGKILSQAEQMAKTPAEQRAVRNLKSYWLADYAKLPDKTRSCITINVKSLLDALRARGIYELFSTQTNCSPEFIFNGAIVILDFPIKDFGDAGLLVQSAYKYLFQRAVERRANQGDRTRPVFLWEDEAHYFFSSYDPKFQQTARSSRVARVMLSQNLNNFYSDLGGGERARHLFNSLLGNMNTRIFHFNGDETTNEWASKMFGSWERPISSSSISTQPHHGLNPFDSEPPVLGHSQSSRREPLVFPEDFSKLLPNFGEGGVLTEAYIYKAGRRFTGTQHSFMKASFIKSKLVKKVQETEGK